MSSKAFLYKKVFDKINKQQEQENEQLYFQQLADDLKNGWVDVEEVTPEVKADISGIRLSVIHAY